MHNLAVGSATAVAASAARRPIAVPGCIRVQMFDSLVGSSSAMSRLREYLPKVARSDSHVLITGDTGTGKERVAECIHAASLRRHAPFLSVNCAAIPDALFESELFGFEQGAFTGAQEGYQGRLRMAANG